MLVAPSGFFLLCSKCYHSSDGGQNLCSHSPCCSICLLLSLSKGSQHLVMRSLRVCNNTITHTHTHHTHYTHTCTHTTHTHTHTHMHTHTYTHRGLTHVAMRPAVRMMGMMASNTRASLQSLIKPIKNPAKNVVTHWISMISLSPMPAWTLSMSLIIVREGRVRIGE